MVTQVDLANTTNSGVPPVEGDLITLSAVFSDPGTLSPHTALVDWGDGSTSVATVDNVNQTFTATHNYLDANYQGLQGHFTVTTTVTDDSNATGVLQTPEIVSNVAPVITSLTTDQPAINEGGTVAVTGAFFDPGTLDTHSLVVDWGDGTSSLAVLDNVNQTFTASHQYLDANYKGQQGQFTITAAVTDDSNATGIATTPLIVHNVAPVITQFTPLNGTTTEGDLVSVTAAFFDPGRATLTPPRSIGVTAPARSRRSTMWRRPLPRHINIWTPISPASKAGSRSRRPSSTTARHRACSRRRSRWSMRRRS
ncbi:MAG: hypothetical protein WDO24_04775 [Pseudomonadota bacterium]